MLRWTENGSLRELASFLRELREHSGTITDDEVVLQVTRAYPAATNCWAFVEYSLAIIASACAERPSVTERLIEEPIRAMVYGGLDQASEVIPQGLALADKLEPAVELLPEGRRWLKESWPQYDVAVRRIFQAIVDE